MSKKEERKLAIKLRKRGFSYSEIRRQIPVAKSTLSDWFRNVGLSKQHKQRLTERKLEAARRGWEKRRAMRIERTRLIKEQAHDEVVKLIKDPFWLTGLILYWGEGTKEKPWRVGEKVAFSNTDVVMIKLFIRWVKQYCDVLDTRIIYELYIHKSGPVQKARSFWKSNLGLQPLSKCFRTYFKRGNKSSKRKNIGGSYNGTMRIVVLKGTDLNRRIAGWLEGVIECFSRNKHWGIV